MTLTALLLSLMPIVAGVPAADAPEGLDPAEIRIGEALFLETRFAEYFATHATGINDPLEHGDPVMDFTLTPSGKLPGPFRGKSMNCRACHLVDEFAATADQPSAAQGGMRTYSDYAPRSPIPHRADGLLFALRNAPSQVNASVERDYRFFHSDGEFGSMEDLVRGTLTGRNSGWLKGEEGQALAHIARVIREDNGQHALAEEDATFAELRYADLLRGRGSKVPEELKLPREYRIDVAKATDTAILDAISKLIAIYVTDLAFSQDEAGYNLSPYDVFLHKNHLPTQPAPNETPAEYSRHLLAALDALTAPEWVSADDGTFASHHQPFQFGAIELEGCKLFLRESRGAVNLPSVGNCAACHPAPHFTDFRFHNTGATQEEYDAIHGAEAFAHLEIPTEKNRAEAVNTASGINPFADIPALEHPGHTDLGLWNVFLNPEFPKTQEKLLAMMRHAHPGVTDAQALLNTTIAAFKTAGLRDLGHSDPYFHTGRFNDLESAVHFYRQFSELARHDAVRNADPELLGVRLEPEDEAKLVAFLRALNEDYE